MKKLVDKTPFKIFIDVFNVLQINGWGSPKHFLLLENLILKGKEAIVKESNSELGKRLWKEP